MSQANGPEATDASAEVPNWQRRSVERSLEAARSKARARCDRFVDAAHDLLRESGEIDFTVQQCVERAGMSIRTFYTFFEGKDDLLYALIYLHGSHDQREGMEAFLAKRAPSFEHR